MKQTILLFLLVCAVGASAQSTCETRVDAHQKATTNQRVNYCLYPGYGAADTHGPQLIYSSMGYYNPGTPAAAAPQRVTARQNVFDDADIEVTHSFVQTRQFPKFTDGRVSEQYKREYQEALLSGPELAREAVSLTDCEPQEDVSFVSVQEGTSEVKSRQKKPGRRWIQKPAAQTEQNAPANLPLDTVEEIASTASSYTYEESSYAPAAQDAYAPATAADTPVTTEAYAPAAGNSPATGNAPAATEISAPAGIADEPVGEGQDIDAAAYSYAPAAAVNETAAPAQAAAATNETEIPAGEYSYAPATK